METFKVYYALFIFQYLWLNADGNDFLPVRGGEAGDDGFGRVQGRNFHGFG